MNKDNLLILQINYIIIFIKKIRLKEQKIIKLLFLTYAIEMPTYSNIL